MSKVQKGATLNITAHRLCHDDGVPYPFVPSPNIGPLIKHHDLLVIHYTEGQSSAAAVAWLTKRKSKASAHLVIGRGGDITQLVSFDVVAWHAGPSSWKGKTRLSEVSLGIELDNPGMLKPASGKWIAAFKRAYPESEFIKAIHKFGGRTFGWHKYTQAQLDSAVEVSAHLVRTYGITDIVGHDDISPKRKWDPGPAFPMETFRAGVLERAAALPPS